MKQRRRRGWIWLLVGAGLVLALLFLPQLLLPPSADLAVSVVDAGTGNPLPEALVWVSAPGAPSRPALATDERGIARFQDLPPGTQGTVWVQKVDYELASESGLALLAGQKNQVRVPLTPHPGDRLFVGLDQARVAEIDLASLLVVQTIRLSGESGGAVQHLLVHPSQGLLYAITRSRVRILDGRGTGSIPRTEGYILDARTGASRGRLDILETWEVSPSIQGLGLSEDGQRLYVVANWVRGMVMVMDAGSGRLLDATHQLYLNASLVEPAPGELARIEVLPSRPTTITTGLEIDVRRALLTRLYDANRNAIVRKPGSAGLYLVRHAGGWQRVEPLDARLQEVLDGLPVGMYPEASLAADGATLYHWGMGYFGTDIPLGDTLYTQALGPGAPRARTQTLPLGTSAMAASPTSQELYVLNAELGTLTLLDPTGAEPPILVPVGKQPVALAVSADGTRAFVANQGSSSITVVNLPTADVAATIPLPGEPHSLALREAGGGP